MKSTFLLRGGVLLLAAAAWLHHAGAQAQGAGQVVTMTRFMKLLGDREQQLLDAIQAKDRAALDRMLAPNFEMRAAHRAGSPVPRGDWINAAIAQGADYRIGQLAVQEVGAIAIASFVLTPATRKGAASFIVDTWVPDGDGWTLRVRHAALMGSNAPQAHLLGDTPVVQPLPKKY
jgi:hypothetical protein